MQEIYAKPIEADLITARVKQIRDAGVTVAASLTPQRTVQFAQTVLDSGVDLFVIQGTVVSAEHVSSRSEPLNLKRFIADLDVPVLVGGCATYQSALHLMRTGAAGILVGVGPGQANTTRGVLGLGVPMATSIADAAGARRDYLDESGGRYVHVIADGGMRTGGDVAKAIACGADAVMMGSPLARADGRARPRLALGPRQLPPRAAPRHARAGRHRRHSRGGPARTGPHRRGHDQPVRRPAHARWR